MLTLSQISSIRWPYYIEGTTSGGKFPSLSTLRKGEVMIYEKLLESRSSRLTTGVIVSIACLALLGFALATSRDIVAPSIVLAVAVFGSIIHFWKGDDVLAQTVSLGCASFIIALNAHAFLGVQIQLAYVVAAITIAVAAYELVRMQMSDFALRFTGALLITIAILWSAATAMAPRQDVIALRAADGEIVNASIGKMITPARTNKDASSTIRFDAYDAPVGSNNFGPDQQFVSREESFARFTDKLTNDPLYLSTMKEFFLHGSALDTTIAVNNARVMMTDSVYRHETLNWVLDQVNTYTSSTTDVNYESLGMIPGADRSVLPELTKFSEQIMLGDVLVIVLNNGQVRLLRVWCDYQPSAYTFKSVQPGPTPVHTVPNGGTGNGEGPSPSTSVESTTETTSSTTQPTTTQPSTTTETTTQPTTTQPSTTTETTTTTTETTTTETTTTTAPPTSTTTTTTTPECPEGHVPSDEGCLEVKDDEEGGYTVLPGVPDATVTGSAAAPTTPAQPAGTTATGAPIPDGGAEGPILAPDATTTEQEALPAPTVSQAPEPSQAPNTDVDPDNGGAPAAAAVDAAAEAAQRQAEQAEAARVAAQQQTVAEVPATEAAVVPVPAAEAPAEAASVPEVPTAETDVELSSVSSLLVPAAVSFAGLVALVGASSAGLFGGRKKKYVLQH